MKTRASTKPPPSSPSTTTVTSALLRPSPNPPKVVILPSPLPSSSARILTLPNPATRTPTRYLIDPDRAAFYEFTALPASSRPKQQRSWILCPSITEKDEGTREGHVLEKGDLYIATPLDPIFLLLPALCRSGEGNWGTLHDHVFLSAHDLAGSYAPLRTILTPALEAKLEAGMSVACDVRRGLMGDGEAYYHLDVGRVAAVLVRKARRMVAHGTWPGSMEEMYVNDRLRVPERGLEVDGDGKALENTMSEGTAAAESSGVAPSAFPPKPDVKEDVTAAAGTSLPPLQSQDNDIPNLLRLRTALTYLVNSYIPPTLRDRLNPILYYPSTPDPQNLTGPPSVFDFRPLDAHLAHVANLHARVQALRGLSENIVGGRKHRRDEEEDEEEGKRRKKEAEKKNVSLGVKKLMKADTTGMRKLSAFFGKK